MARTDLAADLDDLDASVRRHDADRWLASRFIADGQARADVIALYALNHELARIAGAVSEPLMGEIRLTWWMEAIAEIYEARPVRRHPVTLALADAIERNALPRAMFETMIEARYCELENSAPDPDASEGVLMTLAAHILGVMDHPALAAAGRVYAGQGARKAANVLLKDLPVAAFPAVAYAGLSRHPNAGVLERRLRVLWAVTTGQI